MAADTVDRHIVAHAEEHLEQIRPVKGKGGAL